MPLEARSKFRGREVIVFVDTVQPAIIGGGNGGVQVVDETPTGLLNGSNADFQSANSFVSESLVLTVNGLIQTRINDFQVTGNNSFSLTFSPSAGETLRISYVKQ